MTSQGGLGEQKIFYGSWGALTKGMEESKKDCLHIMKLRGNWRL